MNEVIRKTEIHPIDGTPEKRMFWSIISDYDLKTGFVSSSITPSIVGCPSKSKSPVC